MEIAALVIAVGYVLALAAGGVLALLVVVYLFGEAPSEDAETGREAAEKPPVEDRFGAGSIPSPASVGPERPKNEAA